MAAKDDLRVDGIRVPPGAYLPRDIAPVKTSAVIVISLRGAPSKKIAGDVMPRSVKKGPYIEPKLMNKVLRSQQSSSKQVIKTWSRRSTVVPEMVGLTLAVHNGRKFIPIFVAEDMVGHKLGEFAATRTFRGHIVDKAVRR